MPCWRCALHAEVVAAQKPGGMTPDTRAVVRCHAPRHREERCAALDLLRVARVQKLIDLTLLQRHPDTLKLLLRDRARSDNLWLRRAAMLSQRSLKTGFDAVPLHGCVLPLLGNTPLAGEFFIRKGMGWALRERSCAAPDSVLR